MKKNVRSNKSPPRMTSAMGLLILYVLKETNLDSPSIDAEICLRSDKDYLVGTVKSAISRLWKKGLIKEIDIKTDGRLRRVYGITKDGIETLEEYQKLFEPMGGPNCAVTV